MVRMFLIATFMLNALLNFASVNPVSSVRPDCSANSMIINLDFVLVNKTGYDIESIYVAPTKEKSWGEDIMGQDVLANGESVEISFDGNAKVKKWDIYVTWVGYESDEDVYWIGFDLSKISEITLHYDEKTGKTWAVTK